MEILEFLRENLTECCRGGEYCIKYCLILEENGVIIKLKLNIMPLMQRTNL